MTHIYGFWGLPEKIDIKCPHCQGCASFEFARLARIELKKDIDYFQQHLDFEYQRFQDSCGGYWNAALYYPNLSGSLALIQDFPAGYQAETWKSRNLGLAKGGVCCEVCGERRKHDLNWPNDAYYVVMYRQQFLWAFHREAAYELYQYLSEKLRDPWRYRYSFFLLHIPAIFKQKKARDHVMKQLLKLLT